MTVRARVRGRGAAAAALAALVIGAAFAAACTTPSPTPTPSVTSPAPAGPTTATRLSPSTSPVAASPSAGRVAVDASLLDLLPVDVAGHPFEPSPESAQEAASDNELTVHVEALAVAIAADPSTDSFVVASVARLRPGPFDEEFFRDWRDSFDQGVCDRAGGVSGNAQAEIAGRTVYIGTCAGGVHTYHVHLEQPSAIVSLNVVGDATLGQQVLETLRD